MKCSKCGTTGLTENDFYHYATGKIMPHCKECHKKMAEEYRKKHPNYNAEYQSKRYRVNPDKYRREEQERYWSDPEKRRKASRERYWKTSKKKRTQVNFS